MKKQIVCSWSGGIDSTALIAHLLKIGFEVFAYRMKIYGNEFEDRELQAIKALMPVMRKLGEIHFKEIDGKFLWNFSPDNIEIPRRNRLIIDHLIETKCKPMGIYNLGLGEYIGADTWVVQDHVAGSDADARALTSYIYTEYGLKMRLWTLADFGESRFKHNRVNLGTEVIGNDMFLTTNCLNDNLIHCGDCYKCVERTVAFRKIFGFDVTRYKRNPLKSKMYKKYVKQMEE